MNNFEKLQRPDESIGQNITNDNEKKKPLVQDVKKLFGHNLNKWFRDVPTEFRAKVIVALKNALKMRKEANFLSAEDGAQTIFNFVETDKNIAIEKMALDWAALHIAVFPELADEEADELAVYFDRMNEEHTGTSLEGNEEWPMGTLKEFFSKKFGLSKESSGFETHSRAGGSTSAEDFSVEVPSEEEKSVSDSIEKRYLDLGYTVIGKDAEHIFLKKDEQNTTVYFTAWPKSKGKTEILVSVYPSYKDEHTFKKGF